MTQILFWNVDRLAKGTDEVVTNDIFKFVDDSKSTYAYFCEVISDLVLEVYDDGTQTWEESTVEKQGQRSRRRKRLNPYQLGYAGFLPNDKFTDITLTKFTPPKGFKGSERHYVKSEHDIGGVDCYIYHAPSGGDKSEKAQMILGILKDITGKNAQRKFIFFGDLNCQPDDFGDLSQLGFYLANGGVTYPAGNTKSIYDWCICYRCKADVKVIRSTRIKVGNGFASDHVPIMINVI